VAQSGLAYSILRPTVIFGPEDILVNNIAWFVRHRPLFGVPGDGRCGVRPIYVGVMAVLIVKSVEQQQSEILDAVGPETFAFEELVCLIAAQLGQRIRVIHLPILLAYLSTRIAGLFLRDVVLTWQEYQGLLSNLLAPRGPSTGQARLTEWLVQNREHLSTHYASELARHYR
jgi:nucleoside-diphosphate-sugar epimerase